MSHNKHTLELREKIEECGHSLSLFIDLCTSDVQLNQRSKLALSEYGRNRMEAFEDAENLLRRQAEASSEAPQPLRRTA
ncbi:hypothetical protein BJN42_26570 [Pseudomonas koreensis]|jgi:hypothetical protein|uniref:hypothetical protein n=1 Tax=Pseudomonas sp. GXM4 TaxID=2651867 RepID=UPI0008D6E8E8|nr:hypothetical protein [Pseudomonas sp. GXM4]KAB2518416.1 hypothetical protein F8N49_22205 [Pseudomonas sp. GXM4]OFJ42653.1 hypothetical protein BJN42_26570 [Pseudomonas koreensis]